MDIVYARDRQNLDRLVAAIGPLHPLLRGAPPGLPFSFDARTLQAGLNFTLTTAAGDLDLFGEIVGGGDNGALIPNAVVIELFGRPCHCLTLAQLIAAKRAAGRLRDLEVIAELETIRERNPDGA